MNGNTQGLLSENWSTITSTYSVDKRKLTELNSALVIYSSLGYMRGGKGIFLSHDTTCYKKVSFVILAQCTHFVPFQAIVFFVFNCLVFVLPMKLYIKQAKKNSIYCDNRLNHKYQRFSTIKVFFSLLL